MGSGEDQRALKYGPFGLLIDPETMKTRVRFIDRESDFYRLARALEYQGILSDSACEEQS
jgi:6-phosphofructokinase 1